LCDIGFWELVLIGIIGLLVVGPERLPGFARELGRWVRKIRILANNARRELQRELDWEDNGGSWKDVDGLNKQLGEMDRLMRDAPDRQADHKPEYTATGARIDPENNSPDKPAGNDNQPAKQDKG